MQSTAAPFEQVQRLPAIRRRDDVIAAHPFQIVGVLLGESPDIVHHEHESHRGASPARRSGELENHSGSRTRLGFYSQSAAQVENQPADDGKAQPGAARLRGIEVIESAVQLRSGHPGTGVRHRYPHPGGLVPVPGCLGGDRDQPAGSAGDTVHRVAHQVLQDAAKHQTVSHDAWGVALRG